MNRRCIIYQLKGFGKIALDPNSEAYKMYKDKSKVLDQHLWASIKTSDKLEGRIEKRR